MHLRTLEESASHTNLTIDHLSWCSSFFSIAIKNAMTKSKLMRNEFIWFTGHQKEPIQKFKQSRKRAHDWLCIMSQIYLFKGGTSHSRLGLHTSVVNNETAHREAHRPMWWKHFLNWRSFWQHDPTLCQDDKKLHSVAGNKMWNFNLSLTFPVVHTPN